MKITDLLNFDIKDNYVKTLTGNLYFFKILPPNLSILSQNEIQTHVNISQNHSTNGVQRGFYMVVNSKSENDLKQFTSCLKLSQMIFEKQNKQDIINILRGFLLRDFKDFPIEILEQDISLNYDNLKDNHKKRLSPAEFRLDEITKALLPTNMNFKPKCIEQSNFTRQVLLVKNFPLSFNGLAMLSELASIKNTTINMRIAPMNKATAVNLVNKQMSSINSDQTHKKGVEQIHAVEEKTEIENFYKQFFTDKDNIFYLNIYIEIYGEKPEDLEFLHSSVRASLQNTSFELLSYEQKEGFLGVCPLTDDKLKMLANNVPGASLSAMYPFSYSSRNDTEGLFLGHTADNGYMFLDFWTRNNYLTNGNFNILGSSGMGKSYLMKKIISQLISTGVSCYCFDNDAEYVDLFLRMGGTNITATDFKYIINPFEFRNFVDEDGEKDTKGSYLSRHLSWLKSFLTYIIPHATGKEMDLLMVLIKDMYCFHSNSINDDTDISQLEATEYPTFSDLYNFIVKVMTNKKSYKFYDGFDNSRLNECLLLIKDVTDGSLSPLFNGHTNIPNAKHINFDIQELAGGDKNRSQAYMYNIMTYLSSMMFSRTNKMAILVDELALWCNKKNIGVLEYLKNLVARARKYLCIIGTATQQIADVMIDEFKEYTSALYNLASIKFVFNPGEIDLLNFKKFGSFSQEKIDNLIKFNKAECYLSVGTHDKYKIKVGTLPYEKELFGMAGGF